MKQALLILTIILGTVLAACGGNGEEPVPIAETATRTTVAATPVPEPTPTTVPEQEVPDTATPEPMPAPTPTAAPTPTPAPEPTVWTMKPLNTEPPAKEPTATAPPQATAPGMPTETPSAEEPTEEPQPGPTAEELGQGPETDGMYVYRDPEGVFTFSYPADCGKVVEDMGPENSRVAGNEDNCPGNDGEIEVELETYALAEEGEKLPLSPESAAKQVADMVSTLTDDAHRETLTIESGDTLEVVRNVLEAWGDEKIVVVTAIHVSAGWQATDIIMSYWASGEEDPNWDRVLESLRSFSTK